VKAEDVDFEAALVGLSSPVFDDVEIPKVDVEVAPVEVEDGSAVHHLAPLEGTKYMTWPAQILDRSRVDLSAVVDSEIPVAVWTEISTSPGSAKIHCFRVGKLTTSGNDRLDELIIHHLHSVPDMPTLPVPNRRDGGETIVGEPVNRMLMWRIRRRGATISPVTDHLSNIDHFAITNFAPCFPVTDMKASLAHYVGLGFVAMEYEDGMEWAWVRFGIAELHLFLKKDHDPATTAAAADLVVADADALESAWSSTGIGGTSDAYDTSYGMREAVHVDPDNNLIRFGTPLGKDPQVEGRP